MSDQKFTDVFTDGPGPFVTPLLAEFVSLDVPSEGHLIARFRFEDGVEIRLPISTQAAERFCEHIAIYRHTKGRKQTPPDSTAH